MLPVVEQHRQAAAMLPVYAAYRRARASSVAGSCMLMQAVAGSRNWRLQAVAMLAVYAARRRARVSYGRTARKKKKIHVMKEKCLLSAEHRAKTKRPACYNKKTC